MCSCTPSWVWCQISGHLGIALTKRVLFLWLNLIMRQVWFNVFISVWLLSIKLKAFWIWTHLIWVERLAENLTLKLDCDIYINLNYKWQLFLSILQKLLKNMFQSDFNTKKKAILEISLDDCIFKVIKCIMAIHNTA